MKKRKAFFSSADMSVEVWDQASGQKHVLQVKNQFLILYSHSKRPTHPALVVPVDQGIREL